MSLKHFLAVGKMLALLLLFSQSVAARNVVAINQETETVKGTTHALHTNMLQPQAASVSLMPEHTVKPLHPDFVASFYAGKTALALRPPGQIAVILQDVDRCESVSRLLFPFHFFW